MNIRKLLIFFLSTYVLLSPPQCIASYITFSVEVDLTCSMTVSSTSINFGDVKSSDLPVSRDFYIGFENCNSTYTTISFSGDNISQSGTLMLEQNDGHARGLEITFKKEDGTNLDLNSVMDIDSGKNLTLTSILQPIGDLRNVKGGEVKSSLEINVEYR